MGYNKSQGERLNIHEICGEEFESFAKEEITILMDSRARKPSAALLQDVAKTNEHYIKSIVTLKNIRNARAVCIEECHEYAQFNSSQLRTKHREMA